MKSTYLFIFALITVSYIGCKSSTEEKVTYSADIESILTESCGNLYCHGPSHAAGNVLNYESTVSFASQDRFLAAIKHEDNVAPMPQGGEKLPNEQIELIEQWIEQGMIE